MPHPGIVVSAVLIGAVDGDTLDVRGRDGQQHRIRLIGIDTPDQDACGYDAASARLSDIRSPDEVVVLTASIGKVRDPDRYGRFLRYVQDGDEGDGAGDVGAAML